MRTTINIDDDLMRQLKLQALDIVAEMESDNLIRNLELDK